MGKASRDKGNRGELEVAHILKEAGFDVDRVPNSGGLRIKGDLKENEGEQRLRDLHLEVKWQERLALPEWIRQAEAEANDGQVPVVVFRQSKRVGRIGEWQASLPLDALISLLNARFTGEERELLERGVDKMLNAYTFGLDVMPRDVDPTIPLLEALKERLA